MVPYRTEPLVRQKCLEQSELGCIFASHLRHKCRHKVLTNKKLETMQNVQNETEIQQRVINLVELYRSKVGRDSANAKQLRERSAENVKFGFSFNDDKEFLDNIDLLFVNEQLLGHFYVLVAGNSAETDIVQQLLPEKYNNTIFTKDEECFLANHFKELVNYIIQTPDVVFDDTYGYTSDYKSYLLIPDEVLDIIKTRVHIPNTSVIYNPYAGLGQFATLFKCDAVIWGEKDSIYNQYIEYFRKNWENEINFSIKKFAWMKFWIWARIAMYANHIQNINYKDECCPVNYNVVISYIPGGFGLDLDIFKTIYEAYDNLNTHGTMILLCDKETLSHKLDKSFCSKLMERLVDDGSLVEIIQLPPSIMEGQCDCIIIAEKGCSKSYTTFIDARNAFKVLSSKKHTNVLNQINLNAFNAIIDNNGIEEESGLRKLVRIDTAGLNPCMLLPEVHVLERPTAEELPIPLSKLCTHITIKIREVKIDLPTSTPWVNTDDLSFVFQGDLNLSRCVKADCPNNPPHTDEYVFHKSGAFVDNAFLQTSKGHRVAKYRECTYVSGDKDVVLFCVKQNDPQFALIKASGTPIAISPEIEVFVPNEDVDSLSLLALLRLPIVYRQILTYHNIIELIIQDELPSIKKVYGLDLYMDDILVPGNKRVVMEEKKRLLNEEIAYKAIEEKMQIKKTEYINEVRMRKHDMMPHMRQLKSSTKLLQYNIENLNTSDKIKDILTLQVVRCGKALEQLSNIIKHLSDEEPFGKPVLFNLDEYLSHLIKSYSSKADGFRIEYNLDIQSVNKYYRLKDRLIKNAMCDDDDAFMEELATDFDERVIQDRAYIEELTYDLEKPSNKEKVFTEEPAFTIGLQTYTINENTYGKNNQILESTPISHRKFSIPSILIAPNDVQRAVSNIIDNAKVHGFTDSNRKDYEINVTLSIDVDKNMYQLDFRNNGNPLLEGMNKMRYGIMGEKAGKTRGEGLGGNYVKRFVEHNGGDYDIFMEEGWTIVRIYLPIK